MESCSNLAPNALLRHGGHKMLLASIVAVSIQSTPFPYKRSTEITGELARTLTSRKDAFSTELSQRHRLSFLSENGKRLFITEPGNPPVTVAFDVASGKKLHESTGMVWEKGKGPTFYFGRDNTTSSLGTEPRGLLDVCTAIASSTGDDLKFYISARFKGRQYSLMPSMSFRAAMQQVALRVGPPKSNEQLVEFRQDSEGWIALTREETGRTVRFRGYRVLGSGQFAPSNNAFPLISRAVLDVPVTSDPMYGSFPTWAVNKGGSLMAIASSTNRKMRVYDFKRKRWAIHEAGNGGSFTGDAWLLDERLLVEMKDNTGAEAMFEPSKEGWRKVGPYSFVARSRNWKYAVLLNSRSGVAKLLEF